VLREHEGTSLEMNPISGSKLEPWTLDLMSDMSSAAGRPLNWNLLVVTARTLQDAERQLEAGDHAAHRDGRVVALTIPVGGGQLRVSLRSGVLFDAMPTWDEVMLLPPAEKLAVFRDPDARRRLDEAAQGPDNKASYLAHWDRLTVTDVVASENEIYVGRTLGEIADADGRSAWDMLCSIALADELQTGFALIGRPDTQQDWQARAQVWRDRRALIGGSDAGAHLDMMSTAGYTTSMLAAVRDSSLMSMEEAVQLLTQAPANLYGLRDRGTLREGWKADVVVFDPMTIGAEPVEMRYDLPGGPGRLVADAIGVEHVLVNGVPIVSDGVLTAARPGAVLRSGQDTRTPELH
jgi:N-acyl-D-aspartate/D-glutamate deacylase